MYLFVCFRVTTIFDSIACIHEDNHVEIWSVGENGLQPKHGQSKLWAIKQLNYSETFRGWLRT